MVRLKDELIPTRATLLYRLKDFQDQASWQDFFDTYWKLIYGVALNSGLLETEAQEVVQETMISVAKHMPSFKYNSQNGSFKAWLLNMTRWRITDQLRKRKHLTSPSNYHATPETNISVEEVLDQASHSLDAIWDAEWEKNLMEAAMVRVKHRLDPEKYQIFDFYVNKEWSPEKVATSFGISVAQVYLAKHRVIEIIKQEVERLSREAI